MQDREYLVARGVAIFMLRKLLLKYGYNHDVPGTAMRSWVYELHAYPEKESMLYDPRKTWAFRFPDWKKFHRDLKSSRWDRRRGDLNLKSRSNNRRQITTL